MPARTGGPENVRPLLRYAAYRERQTRRLYGVDGGLALGESWRLTNDAEQWDLEAVDSGARIEVRQKAAWQPAWDRNGLGRTYRTFEIPPHKSNKVDLYVFAWHPEADPDIADHRVPEQWRFHVVPERILPRQKTISIGRLRKRWPATTFGGLAGAVNDVIGALPNLKAARPLR